MHNFFCALCSFWQLFSPILVLLVWPIQLVLMVPPVQCLLWCVFFFVVTCFFSSAALCPYFNNFWVQDVWILSLSLFETANFGNFLGVMNRNDSLIFSRETRMCGTLIVTYIHLKLKLHRDSKEKMEYHDWWPKNHVQCYLIIFCWGIIMFMHFVSVF